MDYRVKPCDVCEANSCNNDNYVIAGLDPAIFLIINLKNPHFGSKIMIILTEMGIFLCIL